MNWVKEAESKLRDYAAKERSLESVTERIAQLQAEMTCVRSATTDSTAVHGELVATRRLVDRLNCRS